MVLDAMKAEVRPGVTTRHLDEVGARVMREQGARSAPSMVYKFPGASCISLNDEAVHGIPSARNSRKATVKLDVTVERTATWPTPPSPSSGRVSKQASN